MATYIYQAKKDPQNTVEGKIEAQSEREAIEKISLLGLVPISLREDNNVAAAETAVSQVMVPAGKSGIRLSSREITIFSRQLASLLKSGVPILRSLVIIRDQATNQKLKSIVQNIYKEVEAGAVFSSVLAQYPRVFPALFIALIRAGEDSGALPEVLFKISDYRAKQEEVVSRFKMAMVYPALLAFVGIGTVVFMLTFVMPRLTKLYKDMGQGLPVPTKILIAISSGLAQGWVWALVIIVALIVLIQRYSLTKAGKITKSIIQLNLPLFGSLVLKSELARFSRTLELLLRSGISILRSINVTIPVLDNEIIKSQLNASYRELEQGGSLGRSLKSSKIIPAFMTNLLIVGEETGKLDDALTEIAVSYERDTEEAIRMMASLLEPLMILVMGIVVGFIVVAMLLPIFEMNVMVR
ncbi:MAG: type II secretion system F family protein [Candidatus Omnitrophica bacterium]|nr:type II secretion system F family protein [Candidatus Omnitrophota bacterium]